MLLTFALVVLGWVFFRAETIGEAVEYLGKICNKSLLSVPLLINRNFYIPMFINLALMLAVEWLQRNKQHGLQTFRLQWNKWVRRVAYFILILVVLYHYFMLLSKNQTFIYFQF